MGRGGERETKRLRAKEEVRTQGKRDRETEGEKKEVVNLHWWWVYLLAYEIWNY